MYRGGATCTYWHARPGTPGAGVRAWLCDSSILTYIPRDGDADGDADGDGGGGGDGDGEWMSG